MFDQKDQLNESQKPPNNRRKDDAQDAPERNVVAYLPPAPQPSNLSLLALHRRLALLVAPEGEDGHAAVQYP